MSERAGTAWTEERTQARSAEHATREGGVLATERSEPSNTVTCVDCRGRVEHCHGTLVRHAREVAECTEAECTVPELACHALVLDCVEVNCAVCEAAMARAA